MRVLSCGSLSSRARSSSATVTAVLLFLLIWGSYAYTHNFGGWNENSRFAQLHAWSEGQWTIDQFKKRTFDRARFEDHYYSDKPPGTAVIAAPTFFATKALFDALHIPIHETPGWRMSAWLTTAFSVAILSALGSVLLYLTLAKRLGKRTALLAAVGVGLGSLPFNNSVMLMSHAVTYGLLSLALWASNALDEVALPKSLRAWKRAEPDVRTAIIVGLCCGFTVSGEFPAMFAAGVIFLLLARRGMRTLLIALAAAVPPMLIVLVNNAIAFGSPFSVGYAHLTSFEGMNRGFFGLSFAPNPIVMAQMLFSQYRGLFFWSPVLLLAIPGIWALWREHRTFALATCAVFLVQLAVISSYSYWPGGSSLGPRHMVVTLPFLGIAVGYGIQYWGQRGRRLALILIPISMILIGVCTLIDPGPEKTIALPLQQYYIPKLLGARFNPNLGDVFFNLPDPLSLAPLVLWMAFFLWLLWQRTEEAPARRR